MQRPVPGRFSAATKTREEQVRADDSTVLGDSEPEVGAIKHYHSAEGPLTASECASKTQMSQRHHAHQIQPHLSTTTTTCQAAIMADINPEPINGVMNSALIDL